MCGRYGFAPGEFREIKLRFNIGGDLPLFKPRYNIALLSKRRLSRALRAQTAWNFSNGV